MFKQYYILYEERTLMLQIIVLKNVRREKQSTNVNSPRLSSVLLALSQQHLAQSGKPYTCVQSWWHATSLLRFSFPTHVSSGSWPLRAPPHPPALRAAPDQNRVDAWTGQWCSSKWCFWSDAYPVKFCAVEWHVMCNVPVKSVDVIFRNGSCVRNVGMNGWV